MTVFDIETNGLLDVLTKIHVLSYSHDRKEVKHTHNYDEMRNPDRNVKQGAPMPVRQNNGGEILARMKRDKRSGRKMER